MAEISLIYYKTYLGPWPSLFAKISVEVCACSIYRYVMLAATEIIEKFISFEIKRIES